MPVRSFLAALIALLVCAVPAAAAVSSGSYKGRTDQNRAVAFKVKRGKVTGFVAGVMTFCTTDGNSRFETDAVANVPAMKIRRNGSFAWKGDIEKDGTITMAVKGRIRGGKAKGTVTLSRPDSRYDASRGMVVFGVCAANDRKFTAKVR